MFIDVSLFRGFVHGWGLYFICCFLMGCGSTLPMGAIGGKVDSRFPGTGMIVVTQPEQQQQASNAHKEIFHKVVAGDTLWRISKKYETTVGKIKELNEVTDVHGLKVGMKLKIGFESIGAENQETSPPTAIAKARKKLSKKYPLQWPVEGAITARYGKRRGKPHDGIDIGAPAGTKILASNAGEVLFSASHGGYGKLVVLRHANGLVTVYAHNRKNLVSKGQKVRQGQAIAEVGDSGRSTGPHVHFEVRRGANPQNPLRFLPPS